MYGKPMLDGSKMVKVLELIPLNINNVVGPETNAW